MRAINVVAGKRAWDPYPFILLNLFLSMLAAMQAPVIMMSQNRQDTKDRLRGELDYDVNRRAEVGDPGAGAEVESAGGEDGGRGGYAAGEIGAVRGCVFLARESCSSGFYIAPTGNRQPAFPTCFFPWHKIPQRRRCRTRPFDFAQGIFRGRKGWAPTVGMILKRSKARANCPTAPLKPTPGLNGPPVPTSFLTVPNVRLHNLFGTVWDPAKREFLIFGGYNFNTGQLYGDTWKLMAH